MPLGQTIRVRVAAPPTEARRLCTRLTRGGIPAELDDGSSRVWACVVCWEQYIQFSYPRGSTLPAFSPECARPSR